MRKYIKREDAVFAACKVLDKFGGCKMGALCPDVGCSEVRDIIDTFQMIEIPDQHGRLADADALAKRIKDEWRHQAECYADRYAPVVLAYADCYGKVQSAPTIIPAEPPKEKE